MNNMTATLPSDLIVIIAQLFTSASDVLSFSLVCKRHYSLVLSHIKEKDNKQAQILLNLHLRPEIEVCYYIVVPTDINYGRCHAKVFHSLPSGAKHGESKTYAVRSLEFTNLAVRGPIAPDKTYWFDGFIPQEGIENALPLVIQHGKRFSEGTFEFGKEEGISRSYYCWPDVEPTISTIYPYRNGLLHGEQINYDTDSKRLKEVTPLREGRLHGQRKWWHQGVLSRTQTYEDGRRVLEIETYQAVAGRAVLVMRQRDGETTTITETWDAESGIRITLTDVIFSTSVSSTNPAPPANAANQANPLPPRVHLREEVFGWSTDGLLTTYKLEKNGKIVKQWDRKNAQSCILS